ncbi:MAG TPA: hypothetical protein VFF14_01595 [Candidatus Deferrimicrobium sp.]|nr:hypothetical protein [Candidatus Deferrimicrobium sp.]
MRKKIKLCLLSTLFLLVSISLWNASPIVSYAACGASTSSCKTCHEVQGQDSVGKKGNWHIQHAFGDFCQACHQGVATENNKAQAHTGLVKNPLTQPDQSCASCHPADTATRIAKYSGQVSGGKPATETVQTPTTNTSETGNSSSPQTPVSSPSPSATQIPPSSNPNFDVIDFNKNLVQSLPVLLWVFGMIDILAFLALACLIWRWKIGKWPWVYLHRRKTNLLDLNSIPSEMSQVISSLQECDLETILAIKELLVRGRQGQKLLQTMVQIPADVLSQLQNLSETEFELLFQISRQMRETKGGTNNVN